MTISRKRKRAIKVDGREFLWWVAEDEENWFAPSLHLVSSTGEVFVKYPLATAVGDQYVVSLGSEFRGESGIQGHHSRHPCPRLDETGGITPSQVAELARWVTSGEG